MRLITIINFNRLTALTKIKSCLNFCPKAHLKTLIMAIRKLNELKIYVMSQKPGKLTMNSQKRCIQGHRNVTATTVLRWQTRFSATKEVKRHTSCNTPFHMTVFDMYTSCMILLMYSLSVMLASSRWMGISLRMSAIADTACRRAERQKLVLLHYCTSEHWKYLLWKHD